MENIRLPEALEGKWIWRESPFGETCDRLLLRRDFSVGELPGLSELWVATHGYFALWVNGRLCTLGPVPHPGGGNSAYALKVEITHLLEIGQNHIALSVQFERCALAGVRQSLPGVWLQVNDDGQPVAWTDADWLCASPEDYGNTGLRTSLCDVALEYRDLRKAPGDWQNCDCQELGKHSWLVWQKVNYVRASSPSFGALQPFRQPPDALEKRLPSQMWRGECHEAHAVTWVSFAHVLEQKKTPGLYLAETHISSSVEKKLLCLCFCDASYTLFVNGEKLREQAVPELPLRKACQQPGLSLGSMELIRRDFEMTLRPGWNTILLARQCGGEDSSGLFLWPELETGALTFCQRPNPNAPHGWALSGPLTVPMHILYQAAALRELVKMPFCPEEEEATDRSAYYLACQATADGKGKICLPALLAAQDFIVLDFGRTRYGFPQIQLDGHSGDVVDVVCGEHLAGGGVLSYESGDRRNVTTLILADGKNDWMSVAPRGFRYIQVLNRKSSPAGLSLQAAGYWQETQETSLAGRFQCSSPLLERIWAIGVNTLEATARRIYMDSPVRDQAQSIPDAMIASWAAAYIYGNYAMTGRSLEAFAKAQLETGEMNATAPSGLFQVLPDYSLSWPVWLQQHYQMSGDKALLERLLPALQKQMTYLEEMAVSPDGPLGDFHAYLGVYAFLDYAPMDRVGISTGLNALYCRALMSAAWLMKQAGQLETAKEYRERAGLVAEQVRRLNWNPEYGLFADSFHDGRRSTSLSWQSSLLAIYGGIAQSEEYETIWNRLFTEEPPYELFAAGEYNNPYFQFYVLKTAFALGKSTWALRFMTYYWGKMAEAGAETWREKFDPESPAFNYRICNQCQGYAVSPNAFLISELVGIRPAGPGMRRVYFNPKTGDVRQAKANIPTPRGSISVQWIRENHGFHVRIQADYILEVIPLLPPELDSIAVYNLGDKVTILPEQAWQNTF